jgi:hypothetical protein
MDGFVAALDRETAKVVSFNLARMLVPKMVKNGLNSSFVIWGQF